MGTSRLLERVKGFEMIYLSHFEFPDREAEYNVTMNVQRTCYDTFYPFQVLSKHQLRMLDFEPVTILYGGNGSGKTTALNVIAASIVLRALILRRISSLFIVLIRVAVGYRES